MELEHFYGVIMAGGGGTRLWPFSRRSRPKQMISLGGDRSLFQQAVDRLLGLIPIERILVVTIADQAALLHEQYPELPWDNFLIEPAPRGTASVVGLAAIATRKRDPQATMAVVTADHLISNVIYFQQLLTCGYTLAAENFLVTLGIYPTHPSSGYGYIQRGARIGMRNGIETFEVLRFCEKPDPETARKFLESGEYAWNSGMFIWRSDRIWAEIQRLMPGLFERLERINDAWDTPSRQSALLEHWLPIKPETIDYGIMERAGQVAVIPAENLGWNDVGAWDSLYEVYEQDEQGNIVLEARHVALDSHGMLVVSEDPQRLIVSIGVEDLIVIETENALLICNRSQAQKVRDVVELLKKGDPSELQHLVRRGEDSRRYL
jgi:mannose-1-phosphate guanylyltransferase